MNLQNSKSVKRFIKWFKISLLFILTSITTVHVKAWTVDFSRRTAETQQQPAIQNYPSTLVVSEDKPSSLMSEVFESTAPEEELVLMNTSKGFVPNVLRLKKGQRYKLHIVNVNEREKNVSFILDAFSENHGTFFAEPKVLNLNPKIEGIFSFQCPETGAHGKIIVAPGRRVKSEYK